MAYDTSKTQFRREVALLDATGATKAGLLILGVADPNVGAIPLQTGVIGVATDYSLWICNASSWVLITGGSGGISLPDDTYLTIGTSADSKLGYDSALNTVWLVNTATAAPGTALLGISTQATTTGSSGAAAFGSGATVASASGAVTVKSGLTTGAGASGAVVLGSGAPSGAGGSGAVTVA